MTPSKLKRYNPKHKGHNGLQSKRKTWTNLPILGVFILTVMVQSWKNVISLLTFCISRTIRQYCLVYLPNSSFNLTTNTVEVYLFPTAALQYSLNLISVLKKTTFSLYFIILLNIQSSIICITYKLPIVKDALCYFYTLKMELTKLT